MNPQATTNVHDHDEKREQAELRDALARRTPAWKPIVCAVALVLGVGVLVALGAAPRAARQKEIEATNAALRSATRRVTFVTAKLAPALRTLTLPASLRADANADLVAQTSGYVRERRVDIGDRVHAGDLLAIIDAPLVDEESNRARAALAEAEAAQNVLAHNLSLAQSTLERWRAVEPPGAVSKQELDERSSALESARANHAAGLATIASRRADVQRLEREQGFARIVAPFDGTITTRNVDVGDYVGASGAPKLIFQIADTRVLRAYLDVPQSFAQGVKTGASARVLLKDRPGRTFEGTIARTSGVLDERTRTLRVEVRVPNETNEILAGTYAQVQLELARESTPVIVPGAALLIRAEGPRVAIVDAESKLRYVPVVISRDLGSEAELTSGLKGDERVVVNMADELPEGTLVDAQPLPAPPTPAPKPAAAPAANPSATPSNVPAASATPAGK